MYKFLRIFFSILSAIAVGLAVPLATAFGLTGFFACAFGAVILFGLTWVFKKLHERSEPPQPIDEQTQKDEKRGNQ